MTAGAVMMSGLNAWKRKIVMNVGRITLVKSVAAMCVGNLCSALYLSCLYSLVMAWCLSSMRFSALIVLVLLLVVDVGYGNSSSCSSVFVSLIGWLLFLMG